MSFIKLLQSQRFDSTNEYFSFIKQCSKKQYMPENGPLQTHHIIPKYAFKDTPENQHLMEHPDNLIKLSHEDHLQAHCLLFKLYGNDQDQGAITLLSGDIPAGQKQWHKMGAKASHKVQNNNNITLWNAEYQKEMAKRSMENPRALEFRSEGGKRGGVTRNLDRVITATDRYIFSFKNVEVLCILNCRTGGEVLKELHAFQLTKLTRVTPLLKGERQSLYGWSCKCVTTEK